MHSGFSKENLPRVHYGPITPVRVSEVFEEVYEVFRKGQSWPSSSTQLFGSWR